MIKQEARDEDDEDGEENIAPLPHNESTKCADYTAATLQQQKEHFLQQQEEIVNRLHKAVSDNLKLINQSKESSFSSSSAAKTTTTASMTNNGNSSQQDDLCSNRNSTSASSLNMSSLSANNSRFAMRNFNNVNASESMKACRLTSKSSGTSGSKLLNVAQQLHSNISNDLFCSLIDNDDNNNNNSSNLLHDDNNSDSNYLLPCPLCEIPLEPRVFRQHLDRHYPRDSPICPVLQCGRRFAHPNSVRNHMRLKHSIQWNRMKSMRSSGGPFSSIPY